MTIEIPDKWLGEDIEGSMERVLASKETQEQEGRTNQPIAVQANIDRKDYIQIPGIKGLHGTPVLISKFEIQGANNLSYNDTHRFVLEKGLYVPTPAIFMPHFSNVVDVYRNNKPLFDGNGNPVSRAEIEDMYKHLTTNHMATYGESGQEGAWTWLNGRFVEDRSGFNKLGLEIIVGKEQDGTLKTRTEPLKQHLDANQVYVDLMWNEQGLPTTQSGSGDYQQGKNIRFWKPVNGRVAGFYADSGWAGLSCDGGPDGRDSSLGVFACAESESKIPTDSNSTNSSQGTASRENLGSGGK